MVLRPGRDVIKNQWFTAAFSAAGFGPLLDIQRADERALDRDHDSRRSPIAIQPWQSGWRAGISEDSFYEAQLDDICNGLGPLVGGHGPEPAHHLDHT
jgi:hypothetical protein